MCTTRCMFKILLPPTTHREGGLLRVVSLPCEPACNRGMAQHVVFDLVGLAQPHKCSWHVATCHASSAVQAAYSII